MYNFKDYILYIESKNTHLEHIEDELINLGKDGVERAFNMYTSLIDTLQGHTDQPVDITTKWDGAPAIFAGTDPADGKFFIGTKSVFGKIPKMNKRITDINRNHGDVRRGDSTQDKSMLRKKLKYAFKSLKNIGIDGYVIQGDMLYTKDSIRRANIDGEEHLVFRPNTISYTVPAKSDLAKEMLKSDMGIVFHTMYTGGPTIHDMTASFGFKADKLTKHPSVWFDDATFKDVSGQVQLTSAESLHITNLIRECRNHFWQIQNVFEFLSNTESISDLKAELKVHINSAIRIQGEFESDPKQFADTFISKYIDKATKAIEKLKTEAGQKRKQAAMEKGVQFLRENVTNIEMMYDLYLKLMQIKNIFVTKLSNLRAMDSFIEQEDGSFLVTKPEGFVAVDHIGNAVKLVDRLEFSKANFDPNKKFG
tara:strand:+ start:15349 stop:16617 length:1269 start_codon:yes stop_codon:yes gene_type:complete